jgi:hypothetical protein
MTEKEDTELASTWGRDGRGTNAEADETPIDHADNGIDRSRNRPIGHIIELKTIKYSYCYTYCGYGISERIGILL